MTAPGSNPASPRCGTPPWRSGPWPRRACRRSIPPWPRPLPGCWPNRFSNPGTGASSARTCRRGAGPSSFVNNWYPDVDDSSMVLVALKEGLADTAKHQAALQRGINWCLGMQSKNGGFASFDKDNTKEWLNAIPFGDLKALVDPPTEDITGPHPGDDGGLRSRPGPPRGRPGPGFPAPHPAPRGPLVGTLGGQLPLRHLVGAGGPAAHRRRHEPALRPPGGGLAQGPPEPRRRLGRGLRVLPPPGTHGPGAVHRLPDRLGPLGAHGRGRSPGPGSEGGGRLPGQDPERPGPLGRGALHRHRLPQPLHDSLSPLSGLFSLDGPGGVCAGAQGPGGRMGAAHDPGAEYQEFRCITFCEGGRLLHHRRGTAPPCPYLVGSILVERGCA